MSRKRMLVTGHRGQVVTSLIERNAYAARFDIVTVGRPQFDLRVPESIGPAIERMAPDIIVSAAAFTAVDRAESEEELAMQVNGLAPGEIGRTAARLSVPLIHLSTDYVFDGSSAAPYTEDCPVAPLSVYGRSKLAAERIVERLLGRVQIGQRRGRGLVALALGGHDDETLTGWHCIEGKAVLYLFGRAFAQVRCGQRAVQVEMGCQRR